MRQESRRNLHEFAVRKIIIEREREQARIGKRVCRAQQRQQQQNANATDDRLALCLINPTPSNIGRMNIKCRHCGAKHWAGEQKRITNEFNDCCNFGAIEFAPLIAAPPLIEQLFKGQTEEARHFQDYSRNYNSSLAFASMGGDPGWLDVPAGRGAYCFKVFIIFSP